MDKIIQLYKNGMTVAQVSAECGVTHSKAYRIIKAAGHMRSVKEALAIASAEGRVGAKLRGRKRTFTQAHCDAIRAGRTKWADENSVGVSVKPSGYVEYTRGDNFGRSVHVVTMEDNIGRRLRKDECVHHIDGNRSNNDLSNLALMTRAAHSRLHRLQEEAEGKTRKRGKDGRFR